MAPPLVSLGDETRASGRRPWPLIAGVLVAIALLGLLFLASVIARGNALAFDRTLILAMRVPGHPEVPIGPEKLPSIARDITALGSGTVLTLVVTLATVLLLMRRMWRTAALTLVATIGGATMVSLLKKLFERARPDLVEHLMRETSSSFPSGHSANSAIVYLTVATLLFPMIREARVRLFVVVATMTIVGMIGLSRVYLGVHWPSDVLAGWIFGALWALGCWRAEVGLLARSRRRTASGAATLG
jgi:undecaprenyl-diphosphatase